MDQDINYVNQMKDRNFYFRYRPYSELSVKEVLYHEIFFASVEESDDPYEGFLFIQFAPQKNKWKNLLKYVWNGEFASENVDSVVCFLCDMGSITLQDLKSLDLCSQCKLNGRNLKYNIKMFRNAIDCYSFRKKYFACFSRDCCINLMWSHYADKHKGFCLIFRPDREKFRKDPFICFDKEVKKGCKKIFFEDVKYTSRARKVDGFALFPPDIMEYSLSGKKMAEAQNQVDDFFLEKMKCWDYEKESRLLLPAKVSGLENFSELPKEQRLFRYNAKYLAGIIFGYRMEDSQKKRIREIVRESQIRLTLQNGADKRAPIFMFFEQKMSTSKRQFAPRLLGADISGSFIDADVNNFEEIFARWLEEPFPSR